MILNSKVRKRTSRNWKGMIRKEVVTQKPLNKKILKKVSVLKSLRKIKLRCRLQLKLWSRWNFPRRLYSRYSKKYCSNLRGWTYNRRQFQLQLWNRWSLRWFTCWNWLYWAWSHPWVYTCDSGEPIQSFCMLLFELRIRSQLYRRQLLHQRKLLQRSQTQRSRLLLFPMLLTFSFLIPRMNHPQKDTSKVESIVGFILNIYFKDLVSRRNPNLSDLNGINQFTWFAKWKETQSRRFTGYETTSKSQVSASN